MITQAYKNNFYGDHILWITMNWLEPIWLDNTETLTSCTRDQLLKVIDQTIFMGPTFVNPRKDKAFTGIGVDEFERRFLVQYNNSYPFGSLYRMPSYDHIIAAVLALNITLTKLIESGRSLL